MNTNRITSARFDDWVFQRFRSALADLPLTQEEVARPELLLHEEDPLIYYL
jgi:hypothetical protein